MSIVVGLFVRLLGLAGVTLSPFWGGAIAAGAVVIALGAGGIWIHHSATTAAETVCEAASLKGDNERLELRLAEKTKQLSFITAIQNRDADRATAAEAQLATNQGKIDATPPNATACFTRAMSRRVRDVR